MNRRKFLKTSVGVGVGVGTGLLSTVALNTTGMGGENNKQQKQNINQVFNIKQLNVDLWKRVEELGGLFTNTIVDVVQKNKTTINGSVDWNKKYNNRTDVIPRVRDVFIDNFAKKIIDKQWDYILTQPYCQVAPSQPTTISQITKFAKRYHITDVFIDEDMFYNHYFRHISALYIKRNGINLRPRTQCLNIKINTNLRYNMSQYLLGIDKNTYLSNSTLLNIAQQSSINRRGYQGYLNYGNMLRKSMCTNLFFLGGINK